MADFTIETQGSWDVACGCCGRQSRTVSGLIYHHGTPAAAYFVQWTMGVVESHGANFDLIVGTWGDGASRSKRCAVSLAFRRLDTGPAFMLVDASSRPAGQSDLAAEALRRDQVMGTPLAKTAFDLVDVIWVQDARIQEIVGEAGPG